MFLAIAVDNLANAHVLTEDEKNAKLEHEAKTNGEEKNSSKWGRVGNVQKTLALVSSWRDSVVKTTVVDEPPVSDGQGENGVNG